MTTPAFNTTIHHIQHHDASSKVIFGFWIYILTDCILFASLFATYIVLYNNTYGGPGIAQVTSLPYGLIQTLIIIFSTLTFGFGFAAIYRGNRNQVMFWLVITFLLGLAFLGMEQQQFAHLLHQGYSWQTSAFLTVFFSLIGIYGLHILVALLWIIILMIQLSSQNLTSMMKTRLTCLSLFWNFLNIVWVFIFTIVYLMGAIQHV